MTDIATDLPIDADGNVSLSLLPAIPFHQLAVVRAYKGHHRFAPTVGVGIEGYLNDQEDTGAVAAVVRIECSRAGLPAPTVVLNGPLITLLP